MAMWVVDIVRLATHGRECLVAWRERAREGQGLVSRKPKEIIFWADNFSRLVTATHSPK